jgi:hypothetical protein
MERNYLIIGKDDVFLVDFSKVLQTSSETLRYSIDGNKTIIKWEGEEPSFISSIVYKEGPYNPEEIIEIIKTSEWTNIEND